MELALERYSVSVFQSVASITEGTSYNVGNLVQGVELKNFAH